MNSLLHTMLAIRGELPDFKPKRGTLHTTANDNEQTISKGYNVHSNLARMERTHRELQELLDTLPNEFTREMVINNLKLMIWERTPTVCIKEFIRRGGVEVIQAGRVSANIRYAKCADRMPETSHLIEMRQRAANEKADKAALLEAQEQSDA